MENYGVFQPYSTDSKKTWYTPVVDTVKSWDNNAQYSSSFLDQLSGKISANLNADPNNSLQMGLLKDQFAGQRATESQALNDRYAGYGRGFGPQAAQQLQLSDQMNRAESEAKRKSLADILQMNISNAMGLEGLRSNNFNAYQGRDLSAWGTNEGNKLQQANLNTQIDQQNYLRSPKYGKATAPLLSASYQGGTVNGGIMGPDGKMYTEDNYNLLFSGIDRAGR
jgi:hypothetical protein